MILIADALTADRLAVQQWVAGGMPHQPGTEGMPDVWSVYLTTDDALRYPMPAAGTPDGEQSHGDTMLRGSRGELHARH